MPRSGCAMSIRRSAARRAPSASSQRGRCCEVTQSNRGKTAEGARGEVTAPGAPRSAFEPGCNSPASADTVGRPRAPHESAPVRRRPARNRFTSWTCGHHPRSKLRQAPRGGNIEAFVNASLTRHALSRAAGSGQRDGDIRDAAHGAARGAALSLLNLARDPRELRDQLVVARRCLLEHVP